MTTGSLTPSLNNNALVAIFLFSGANVSPDACRIQANYTNTFEKGCPMSYLSEVFYIQGENGGSASQAVVGKVVQRYRLYKEIPKRFKEIMVSWPRVASLPLFSL
jgi:hypothetical protein